MTEIKYQNKTNLHFERNQIQFKFKIHSIKISHHYHQRIVYLAFYYHNRVFLISPSSQLSKFKKIYTIFPLPFPRLHNLLPSTQPNAISNIFFLIKSNHPLTIHIKLMKDEVEMATKTIHLFCKNCQFAKSSNNNTTGKPTRLKYTCIPA